MNTWRTGQEYLPGEVVVLYGIEYRCLVAHKSVVFANDYFDKKYWTPV